MGYNSSPQTYLFEIVNFKLLFSPPNTVKDWTSTNCKQRFSLEAKAFQKQY